MIIGCTSVYYSELPILIVVPTRTTLTGNKVRNVNFWSI